jgi:hypothetical protein
MKTDPKLESFAMFYTHRFARPETLDRATYWLTRFGIKAPQMRVDHQTHVISFHVGMGQIAGVDSLINALERSDRTHSSEDVDAAWKKAAEEFRAPEHHAIQARTPIGWHADDDRRPAEPGLDAVFEAIRRSE